MDHRLSLDRIEAASREIDPVFRRSPQFLCEPLSDLLGARLVVKVETINPIRSFKGRGSDVFVRSAVGRGEGGPLVCASAGNFGQAMAYACRAHGLPLIVYAAITANPLKVERMRALGAEVRQVGEDFDAAKLEAKRFATARGLTEAEDGRQPEFAEGAATIGVELLADAESFDALVIPLGNGALLTGIGRWVKAHSPRTKIIGVSAAGAPAMERSWREGRVVELPRIETIADGIGVRVPIPEAVADMGGLVDDVLLVEDSAILEAMRLAHRHLGVVLEPAGAAGLAGLFAQRERFAGQTVGTVLCGGNLTPEQMRTWLG
jgi:threonine dehydratase